MHAKLLQSCLTLCDPMDCSLPGSSVHGILQEHWSGLPCPPPGDLPDPGIKRTSSAAPAWQADSLLLCHWEIGYHNKFNDHLSSHIDTNSRNRKKFSLLLALLRFTLLTTFT